eukprot:jgi/Tetstr1/434942/TSEL_023938.t1
MHVVHEKSKTRGHVVFMHKTWNEQWGPTEEYGKHAIVRDRRAEAEQHDNHVYVGEVQYVMVIHTSPSVPDLALDVCRQHGAERVMIGSPLGTGVWQQSKATLLPNIRKGHHAFSVALKHIEKKL